MEKNKEISFENRIDNGIALLKLHGSLSWQRLPKDAKPKYPEYNLILSEEERLICNKKHDYIDLWDALNAPPYIVTPIWNKSPMKSNYLKDIWYAAFNALVDAELISIIGYSLPQEDLHARALLRNGIFLNQKKTEKDIFVIDPNPDIADKYYSTITSQVSYIQGHFTGKELVIKKK
jgi:hypothetical protein